MRITSGGSSRTVRSLAWAAAAMLAACGSVRAFEGIIDMRMSTSTAEGSMGGGTMRYCISEAGTRSEMAMTMHGMAVKHVMLCRNDDPDRMLRIDDAKRTYAVVDLSLLSDAVADAPGGEPFTIRKLGSETILGHETEHVEAVRDDMRMELWIAEGLLDPAVFEQMQARMARGRSPGQGLFQALKEAGVEGMPLRTVVHMPDEGRQTVEVTKIDQTRLPASLFAVPDGYRQVQSSLMDGIEGPGVEEMKQRMQEAMQNMTPEQRQMMESMMKRQQ